MKIGIGSGSFFGYGGDYVSAMKHLKELGYDAIDFQALDDQGGHNKLFDQPQDVFEQWLLDVKKAADEIGLELYQAHGPWQYPPQDDTPEKREARFELFCRSLRGAALMGIKNWIIHPLMPFGCWENPDPEEFRRINLEFFTRLVKVAEECGVVINFENMPFPALDLARVTDILAFVKEIDSPNMKVCLDTGHCLVCKEDITEAVKLIGKEYLATVHVHDNRQKGQDEHFLPMFGAKDWRDYSHADMFVNFAAALEEIGYEGVFSLETSAKGKEMPQAIRHRYQTALAMLAKWLSKKPE